MGHKSAIKPRLIISSYDNIRNPFYKGGGARILDELAQRLSSIYKITIITARHPESSDFINGAVKYKHIGPHWCGPQLGQLFFHMLLPFYAANSIYDAWIESFTPPFSTSCLQLFTKKPVIGLAHMLASEDMWRKYKVPFHLIENAGLKTYKNFIALTPNEERKIRKHNKSASIHTIPNGIHSIGMNLKTKPNTKNPFILYIGRIEYNQKGLDLLLKAYESIVQDTNVKLVIAGTGKKRDLVELNNAIKQIGLTDKIVLKGEVGGKEKDTLFRESSLVVQPSRYETFSVVALEAMMYGKPLITFDIDGLLWLPETCVVRVPRFNHDLLGRTILDLLNDQKTQKKLSREGRKYVREFAWSSITKRYDHAISKVINIAI